MMKRGPLTGGEREGLVRLAWVSVLTLIAVALLTALMGTFGQENVMLFLAAFIGLLGIIVGGQMFVFSFPRLWVVSMILIPTAFLCGAAIGAAITGLY